MQKTKKVGVFRDAQWPHSERIENLSVENGVMQVMLLLSQVSRSLGWKVRLTLRKSDIFGFMCVAIETELGPKKVWRRT